MPDVLSAPSITITPDTDTGDRDSAAATDRTPDRPTIAANDGDSGERLPWSEPPLPNGMQRTYLTSGGSAVVAVVFLVFVAILLAYFSSATSWAHW
jgi:hypothetical protein